MEEIRKVEGLAIEGLEAQTVELLPDREEMVVIIAGSLAVAGQGAQAGQGQVNINVYP